MSLIGIINLTSYPQHPPPKYMDLRVYHSNRAVCRKSYRLWYTSQRMCNVHNVVMCMLYNINIPVYYNIVMSIVQLNERSLSKIATPYITETTTTHRSSYHIWPKPVIIAM